MIALKESSFLFKSILIFVSVERSALNGKAIYDSDSILLTAQTLIPPGWAETLSTARFPSGYEFRDYWDRGSVFQDKHFLNAVILEKDNFVGCHPSSLSQLQMKEENISRILRQRMRLSSFLTHVQLIGRESKKMSNYTSDSNSKKLLKYSKSVFLCNQQ